MFFLSPALHTSPPIEGLGEVIIIESAKFIATNLHSSQKSRTFAP